jgi:hypothetical protein
MNGPLSRPVFRFTVANAAGQERLASTSRWAGSGRSLRREPRSAVRTRFIPARNCTELVGLKWSDEFGQRVKMYPTLMNGYGSDEETELFRPV